MAKEEVKKTKLVLVQFWETEKKTYSPGEYYSTSNEKVIEFLTTNNIATLWQQSTK